MNKIRLSVSVTSADPQLIARTSEQLARTAAGLALDGAEAFMTIGPDLDPDDQ